MALAAHGRAALPAAPESAAPGAAAARHGATPLVERLVLPRDDGRRAWRLAIAHPPGVPPAGGWPVLYLLDGNASAGALLRASPGIARSMVVVGVGYDVEARFDLDTRAWDYTPLPPGAPASGAPDPRAPGRLNGGADALLDAIETRIKPLVASRAPIDARRQALYGHSYGGLFVLHALFARPGAFQAYIAASPSVWWHAPLMQDRAQAYVAQARTGALPPARLAIMVGAGERLRHDGGPGAPRRDEGRPTAGDARALAGVLRQAPNLAVAFREFPALGHGAMLPATVEPAARYALGAPER
ncbi:alpha/beta hydrolase [Bordetella sp. 2513F-2]